MNGALLTPGSEVGSFRIVRAISTNGSCQIYEVINADGVRFAMKAVTSALVMKVGGPEAFMTMGRKLAEIEHPNIAAPQDFIKMNDGRLGVITEFIDGLTIDQYVRKFPLGLADLVDFLRQMTDALRAAQIAGLTHGDFRSGNVLIANVSNFAGNFERRLVITDFGLPPQERLHANEGIGDLRGLGEIMWGLFGGEPSAQLPKRVSALLPEALLDLLLALKTAEPSETPVSLDLVLEQSSMLEYGNFPDSLKKASPTVVGVTNLDAIRARCGKTYAAIEILFIAKLAVELDLKSGAPNGEAAAQNLAQVPDIEVSGESIDKALEVYKLSTRSKTRGSFKTLPRISLNPKVAAVAFVIFCLVGYVRFAPTSTSAQKPAPREPAQEVVAVAAPKPETPRVVAPQPSLVAGDTFWFQVTTSGDAKLSEVWAVREVQGSKILWADGKNLRKTTALNPFWGAIESQAETDERGTLEPTVLPARDFFPLVTGAEERVVFTGRSADGARVWKKDQTCRVIAQSVVENRLGRLDVFDVVCDSFLPQGLVTETYRYAPALRHWLSKKTESPGPGGVTQWRFTEVISYRWGSRP